MAPNADWPQDLPNYNPDMLKFKWYVTSYTNEDDKGVMRIKLDFNSPGSISPNLDQDGITVDFTEAVNQGLITSVGGIGLYPKYIRPSSKVRSQMKDTRFNRQFLQTTGSSKEAGKYVLVATLGLNLVFSAAFGYMVQWMNSMQMVIHLPMMQIIVPGNVSAYF
jgi:hypothetical protein